MKYDFDQVICRKNTGSSKWDNVKARVGNGDALPMWVADTDFTCPQPVIDAVVERARHPVYGYPYVEPEFYTSTVDWVKRRHGWTIRPEWLVFATGVVPVFNTLIQAVTEPGDKIIIQKPVYHPFINVVGDNRREVSSNSLIYRDGKYTMDFEDLERRAADPRAKVMIFSSPHNPVGRVWSEEELAKTAEICFRNQVILISDEIHSDLIFDGHKHIPTASLNEKWAQNIITCYAPSKTFNTAGLRGSGIVVPNEALRRKLQEQFVANRSIQQNIFAMPAYVAAYSGACDDYLEQLLVYLQANIDYLDGYLKEHMPKIKMVRPEATYLTWLDCTELGICGEELAKFFIDECLVAVNKGTMFGQEEGSCFARLNIGCPRVTLEEGLGRIRREYAKRW